MAHFAQLDENNIVLQVIVVNNDDVQNLPLASLSVSPCLVLAPNGSRQATTAISARTTLVRDISMTLHAMLLSRRSHTQAGCWTKAPASGTRPSPTRRMRSLPFVILLLAN